MIAKMSLMLISIRSLLFLAFNLVSFSVQAAAYDPFDTEAMAPLKPSPRLSARVGEAPCSTELPATLLTAIDAVDLTLCNNPQTREIWAAARAQAALVGVARAAWLPSLDGRLASARNFAEAGSFNQNTAALTLSWLMFDFGQRSANLENAQQLLLAATASQSAAVQSLFLSALQSFYTAQAAQAALVSASQAELSATEGFQVAEGRYKVGVATPADRLQAQTALAQATLNRIKAEGEVRNTLGTLANVLGFDARQPLLLVEPPAVPAEMAFQRDVDVLIDEARQRRPDLLAAEAQLRAAEASIVSAQAQGRPTISLLAGPSWQDVGGVTNNGGSIGVAVNLPIFSGFATSYRVRSAAAQAEVKAAQRDRIRSQIALDVWKAYQSLSTATQSLQATATLVASAEQSERVALGRYKAGVGTVLDLLTAQSTLASARVQRIQAALDWQVFRATLAQTMGALDYSLLQPATQGRP